MRTSNIKLSMAVLLAAKMVSLFIRLMLWTKIKVEGIDSHNPTMLFLIKIMKDWRFLYVADHLPSVYRTPYVTLLKHPEI